MSDLETSIDMNARKSSDRVDHEQFQSYLNLETLICFSRGTSISPNGIKAPTSPNFQKISRIFEGSYLSEFQMMEAPICLNFQNRRHFDLFFFIFSCKNTVSNSNLLV